MPLSQDLIEICAKELQSWGMEASQEMRRLLKLRLKQNSQVSILEQSIVFDGTKVTTDGTIAIWNLNDYWVYIDLGVKGVQNKSKTFTSLDYPGGFQFKTLGVGFKMATALQSYVTRKGIKVTARKGQSTTEAAFSKGFAMAKAIKRKGITGTRFYSDVFNEKGFKKLTDRLENALGQKIEIKIIQEFKA